MIVMALPTDLSPSAINPPQTLPFSLAPLPTPITEPSLATESLLPQGGGIHWNRTTTMRISKKRRISTERGKITRIFMREKYYRMNSNLSTKNSTMPRRKILMNTCISMKRITWSENNANSGTKNKKMATMTTNKMRKSGTRSLTGSLLWTLYCP